MRIFHRVLKNHYLLLVHISDEDRKAIFQASKSLLFDKDKPWSKKGNSDFDIGMGSYHGAECCELVGLFLLSLLQHLKINLGVYRDDALGAGLLTARQMEQTKKEICRIFREQNLSITIEANKKIVNFLDVTLDLNSGIYKPYMKPNNTPLYINKDSNHPPSIIKNIPAAVNKRLCNISANERVFKEAIPPYQNALNKSGYDYKLRYEKVTNNNNNKRNRHRNVTWFNPPFSTNVYTNIGAKFLKIQGVSKRITH